MRRSPSRESAEGPVACAMQQPSTSQDAGRQTLRRLSVSSADIPADSSEFWGKCSNAELVQMVLEMEPNRQSTDYAELMRCRALTRVPQLLALPRGSEALALLVTHGHGQASDIACEHALQLLVEAFSVYQDVAPSLWDAAAAFLASHIESFKEDSRFIRLMVKFLVADRLRTQRRSTSSNLSLVGVTLLNQLPTICLTFAGSRAIIALLSDSALGPHVRRRIVDKVASIGCSAHGKSAVIALIRYYGRVPNSLFVKLMKTDAATRLPVYLVLASSRFGYKVAMAVAQMARGAQILILSELVMASYPAVQSDTAILQWAHQQPTRHTVLAAYDDSSYSNVLISLQHVLPSAGLQVWLCSAAQRDSGVPPPQLRVCPAHSTNGICPHGLSCLEVHLTREALNSLSPNYCCLYHSASIVQQPAEHPNGDCVFIELPDGESCKRIVEDRFAITAALQSYFACSSHDPVPTSQVCKFHHRGHCRFGASCNYLHICREVFDELKIERSIEPDAVSTEASDIPRTEPCSWPPARHQGGAVRAEELTRQWSAELLHSDRFMEDSEAASDTGRLSFADGRQESEFSLPTVSSVPELFELHSHSDTPRPFSFSGENATPRQQSLPQDMFNSLDDESTGSAGHRAGSYTHQPYSAQVTPLLERRHRQQQAVELWEGTSTDDQNLRSAALLSSSPDSPLRNSHSLHPQPQPQPQQPPRRRNAPAPVCKYFKLGICNKGNACNFVHVPTAHQQPTSRGYFASGVSS